jgi:hypothetical protein
MPDPSSARYGLIAVIVGIAAVLIICLYAMVHWQSAADVATAISPVTGIIGTIIAAFFGVQVGASGKQRAEDQRDKVQAQNGALLGMLPPEQYEKVLKEHAELFR